MLDWSILHRWLSFLWQIDKTRTFSQISNRIGSSACLLREIVIKMAYSTKIGWYMKDESSIYVQFEPEMPTRVLTVSMGNKVCKRIIPSHVSTITVENEAWATGLPFQLETWLELKYFPVTT